MEKTPRLQLDRAAWIQGALDILADAIAAVRR